jgi:hypothetical protein
MNQSQVDRAVARVTGESLQEIRRRGFGILAPPLKVFEPEPLSTPLVIDWDEVQGSELPRRYHRPSLSAA